MNTISNELINIFSSNIWQQKIYDQNLKTTILEYKCLTNSSIFVKHIKNKQNKPRKSFKSKQTIFDYKTTGKKVFIRSACKSKLNRSKNTTNILSLIITQYLCRVSCVISNLHNQNISAGGKVYGDNHPQMINTKQKLLKNFF